MKKTLVILLLFTFTQSFGQNYKFGKVSLEELEEKTCSIDTSADAAILYRRQQMYFSYSKVKGFYAVNEYFVRIKIYNKDGAKWATKKIYTARKKGNVQSLKAVTYNLKDGEIIKTKLSKKDIFLEHTSKNIDAKKFTMPNIKDGSVIEYKYIVESPDFYTSFRIDVQSKIPTKKMYAEISIPEYFVYKHKNIGYIPIQPKKREDAQTINFVRRVGEARGRTYESVQVSYIEYVKIIDEENIPAIKEEPYAGNIDNYRSALVFELDYTRFPSSAVKYYTTDWESVSKEIYKDSDFGKQLNKKRYFEDDLNVAIAGIDSTDEKIDAILALVKRKMKWNDKNGLFTSRGVKKAYEEGVGNVADINLSLVAMLKAAGLDANPVLVSTIDHGIAIFPTIQGFNYVIAEVSTTSGKILLDATDKNSMPNVLPDRVHNFRGRLIKKDGTSAWIDLFPKTHSIKQYTIFTKFVEDGLEGGVRKMINKDYLISYRNKMQEESEENKLLFLENEYQGIEIENLKISNLDNLKEGIIEKFQFTSESFYEELASKIFVSPLLFLQLEKNPFVAEKRDYPVYYNKPWAESISANLVAPEGYVVESVPENVSFSMPNDLGVYKYETKQMNNIITIKSTIMINQAVISQLNYQDLKDFYKKIIDKQAEKIVLKQNG